MFNQLFLFGRELADANRLLSSSYESRRLVIYAESAAYFRYFEGLFNYILSNSELSITYISADANDPIFHLNNNRVHSYYLNSLLSGVFGRLDAQIVLMTTPGLNRSYLKKPQDANCEFIYIFHAAVSTHLQYQLGAFDFYDTIFMVGPHHETEIRKAELLYGTQKKNLVQSGYYFTENLFLQSNEKQVPHNDNSFRALVAPSWFKGCIFESCIEELVKVLLSQDWQVTLRPHPEFVKRYPRKVKTLQYITDKSPLLALETSPLDLSLLETDLLITDRSGICFEYAFAREKPVLFIDTPLKVLNPEYSRLDIDPIEISTRSDIGLSVSPEALGNIPAKVKELTSRQHEFAELIRQTRRKTQYNWLASAEVGGKYILERLIH